MSNADGRCYTLMVQGTASDAGKSVLVAALCRCLMRRGVKVAPFKPQNMALNSAVTAQGGEIGRAQAMQAQAAGVAVHVDMNPILLKPATDTGAQVIVLGQAIGTMQAGAYHHYKTTALPVVLAAHQRLTQSYQAIIVEGAGSPAEINLRDRDIANMGFAQAVDCPVILVADIDKGGVFAQIVGTLELLCPSERERIIGVVINKFRGDIALLQPGLEWLQQYTHKPVLGVLPYLPQLRVAAEDGIQAQQHLSDAVLKVVVPVFARISNHTDFDMLRSHPQIDLQFVPQGQALPAADLIILPGSKQVRDDLALLRNHRWDQMIARHLRYGGKLLGICGGYPMLGHAICGDKAVGGRAGRSQGLGYLPIETSLYPTKQLSQNQGWLRLGDSEQPAWIAGYQIHAGRSTYTAPVRCFAQLEDGTQEGCISDDNQVAGSYLHGLFDQPQALQQIIRWAGAQVEAPADYVSQQEQQIDAIADACEQALDWTIIDRYLGSVGPLQSDRAESL